VGSKPLDLEDKTLELTVSLGVADLGMLVEPTAEALIEAADSALYVAKRNGKNRVEIFDPESDPTRLV
jgi:diguanylate cyclase (GGDEF)-like protein